MTKSKQGVGATKLEKNVDRLVACTGERDMYPIIRDMLISGPIGIRLTSDHIVVDTNLQGDAAAPDLALYTGPKEKPVRTSDYLFAVIECKPKGTGSSNLDTILEEKRKYVQVATRWFYVADQKVVARLDLDNEDEGWNTRTWEDLRNLDAFRDMFSKVSAAEIRLENQLKQFEENKLRVAHRDVEKHGRRAFINTVRQVSRILDEAVTKVIARQVRPSVRIARTLIEEMESDWGRAVYRWDASRGSPIEFERATEIGMTSAQSREYAVKHADFMSMMRPHLSAWRLEVEALPTYAEKIGKEQVSFASNSKADKKAIAAFAYETGSLILSRMLMVRFSEDNGFLDRQISNGGVKLFSAYAAYFRRGYQALLTQAYKSARALYHDLFDAHALDWVIDTDDEEMSLAIRHALFLLARWDFQTVRGDILSGVYDHYLETERRRALGEVFTRPEIARYILEACGWDKSKTMIDPACGTGTFLVEALRKEVDRLKTAGAFRPESAEQLLNNINGLDINPFSVSLSQIQILWHVMDLFKGQTPKVVSEAASRILPHIMVDGGISSLDTMGISMAATGQTDLDLGSGKAQASGRRMHDYPARFRQINGRSYDIVVGNPPYVRAARQAKQHLASDFDAISKGQIDLYVPFVFRALKWWLKPGGRMGLVIPMAVLDAVYAEPLRAVLAEYRILEIIDLELLRKKTFHGVKRPTVVLIVENDRPQDDDLVTITTVPPDAHDAVADTVDMTKSVKAKIARRDLLLTSYLPASFLNDQALITLSKACVGSGTELTTKVKPDDIQVLKRIGQARRLIADIDLVWTTKNDAPTLTPPQPHRRKNWKATPLIQYGLKLGGDAALSAPQGPPVYRGLNIFPGRLLGQPTGNWAIGEETSSNIYRYRSLLEHDRLYASREIAQVPTMSKVPQGIVFQNTALLIQLAKPFPLNVWVLSRVVQFYCAKLLRGSVIEDITAHWYKRQLSLLPMPSKASDELIASITEIGERLFAADREIADEYASLDALIAQGSNDLLELISADDPLTSGLSVVNVPDDDITITSLTEIPGGITLNGDMVIPVSDRRLRRWLCHQMERRFEEGSQETNRKNFLSILVPRDIDDALTELDRLASSDPAGAYEEALDELDTVVAAALKLDDEDRQYIKLQMQQDQFLKTITPSLERRGLSKQSYRGDAGEEDL